MISWIGRWLESAVNFANRFFTDVGESRGFKVSRNIFRFLFGIPLGATRLLIFDAPLHGIIFGLKVANTVTFQPWKEIPKKRYVDPFFEYLSEEAKKMTSNFVSGFMFGAYIETANYLKEKVAERESENFGTSKGNGNSRENFVAINSSDKAAFIAGEVKAADTNLLLDKRREFMPRISTQLIEMGHSNSRGRRP
jgi:hypothetical protein